MINHADQRKEKEKEKDHSSLPSSSYPVVDPSIYEEKIDKEEETQALHRWRQLKFVVGTLSSVWRGVEEDI